jgi:hypothetical protein
MTEADWLACTDPGPMLDLILGRATDRKLRLFAVACCRRVWHLMAHERSRTAIEAAERYAEGLMSREELRAAAKEALAVLQEPWPGLYWGHSARRQTQRVRMQRACYHAAKSTAEVSSPHLDVNQVIFLTLGADSEVQMAETGRVTPREDEVQCRFLRDIFGPLPFRPVAIDRSFLACNDCLIPRLAQAIYEERRWGDMPILADALLDAGCDNEEMLMHARERGAVHTRGCWLLDLLLSKE